ncbi:MAG: helix-turn-helix domain-containing protein [Gammaproteobacteria bacterium]|jgi:transcriptional regulator GlxA family with amidase domain|nr:helix-turn-helix domain-containing protein [Gammaproteobacteria bacterium]MCP4879796.1 helix-turn-helix domain-containing protein [Gammaproteobacteria bacterium]MDP6166563.1 helix-turn-helix domain-containing protein [Gammaproteobacteria bacterium]
MQFTSAFPSHNYTHKAKSLPIGIPSGEALMDHMLQTHKDTTSYIRATMGNNIQLPQLVEETLALMENNLEEPLSICELADLMGFSRRHLERQFAACLDSSPSKAYMEIRLRYAHNLIANTHFKICQISRLCGFGSSTSFSCLFKQKFSISPSQVRK